MAFYQGGAKQIEPNDVFYNLTVLSFGLDSLDLDSNYDLDDMIIDNFKDTDNIDLTSSTGEFHESTGFAGALTGSITNTYNVDGGVTKSGSIQALTLDNNCVSLTVESWGGRGGASEQSWEQGYNRHDDDTAEGDNADADYIGGFTVRLKGIFEGFAGGETINIAVGKGGNGGTTASHGPHSGGGGASWVVLDHGSGTTIGQTRGSSNSQRYTPLLIAGGGGGAGVRNGYQYNQSSVAWESKEETSAVIATSNGASNAIGDASFPVSARVDGAGGLSVTANASAYSGGGGGGFLTDGGDGTAHNGNGLGGHSFCTATTPLEGGYGAGSYGDCTGGYGGGGSGNLNGGGGGGGYSGGSSSGEWSSHGVNGSGGGSIFGYTTADAAAYNNTISFTPVISVVADNDTNKSPTTNGFHGRVIITQSTINPGNVVLVSTATSGSSVPSKADLIIGYSNGAASAEAIINTDIKGYVSRDDGDTWDEVTLTEQGSVGEFSMLTSYNTSLTGASESTMKWKVQTFNQDRDKYQRIHAVSFGWK